MKMWMAEFTCNNGNDETAITLFPEGVEVNGIQDVRECIVRHHWSDGSVTIEVERVGNVQWREVEV